MKLKLLFACLLLCGCAMPVLCQDTQTQPTEPPDLLVQKFSWSKERIGWESDPFKTYGEDDEARRTRLRQEKRASDAKGSGNSSTVNRQEDDLRIANAIKLRERQQTKPPRYVFLYKLQVKNIGQKTVKAVYWDYVFYDNSTGQEVGRRQFLSEEKINPNKSKTLEFTVRNPPAQVISVHSLEKKEADSLKGKIEILRVEYEDGTAWECPQLKSGNE